ncbi:unnamed protein product [Cochlearia groenlandica]
MRNLPRFKDRFFPPLRNKTFSTHQRYDSIDSKSREARIGSDLIRPDRDEEDEEEEESNFLRSPSSFETQIESNLRNQY